MKIINKAKRIIAGILVFCTIFSVVPSWNLIESQAAPITDLDKDDTMIKNGGGTTTAYLWKGAGVFDIAGIKDAEKIGKPNPYVANRNTSVITTYNFDGYETVISSNGTSSTELKISGNGEVQDLTSTFGVEVQMKVYPSADQKWILVDYIVKNKRGAANTIYIASGADTQVGGITGGGYDDPADASTLYLDDRGFHMVNDDLPAYSKTGTKEIFDMITNGDDPIGNVLGVTTVDTRWGGYYGHRKSANTKPTNYGKINYFVDFASMPTSEYNSSIAYGGVGEGQTTIDGFPAVKGVDSGLAYSWKIDLSDYQTVTKRVAFGAKGPSFYVSKTGTTEAAGATGTFDRPFSTIEEAMGKVTGNMGYILIQDYNPITTPIKVTKNITFQTADYDQQRNMISNNVTLHRKNPNSGPLFTTDGAGSSIGLSDIVLSGDNLAGNNSPLVSAAEGTVRIQSGARLIDSIVDDSNETTAVGSALHITGSANLEINSGEITGNQSALRGAVYFNSSGSFKVRNATHIDGNKLLSDNTVPLNTYLADQKTIIIEKEGLNDRVDGDGNVLLSPKIGITTEKLPEAYSTSEELGNSSSFDDKKKIIVDSTLCDTSLDPSMFVDLFSADQKALYDVDIYSHGEDVILRRNGLEIIKEYVDTSGIAISPPESVFYPTGQAISEAPKDTSVIVNGSDYEYLKTEVLGANGLTILANDIGLEVKGTVTGNMPANSFNIVYTYARKASKIIFDAQGGSLTPTPWAGYVGESLAGKMLPPAAIMNKTGYTFTGWYKEAACINPITDADLTSAAFEAADVTYYAGWAASGASAFTVEFINSDESIVFQTGFNNYPVDTSVSASQKHVPGYGIEDRYVVPSLKNQVINPGTGQIIGEMLAQPVTATYKYKVDYSQSFQVKVKHQNLLGMKIREDVILTQYPEDDLIISPSLINGYQYVSHSVTQAAPSPATDLVSTMAETFDNAGVLTTKMPNRNVELIYKYEPSGAGFDFIAKYVLTSDQSNLKVPVASAEIPDAIIHHTYQKPYGYVFDGNSQKDPISAVGTFNTTTHDYNGTMPMTSLMITYGHDYDSSLWKDITFKAAAHGSVTNTGRPKLTAAGAGQWNASILIHDGSTEADTGAYTWQKIQDYKLYPVAVPENHYYRFKGWYIDNGSGTYQESERLTDSYQFNGPTTVAAVFEEDPAWWIDISFAAGDNGSITGASTCHIPRDKTWGDVPSYVTMPNTNPVQNYRDDGWYDDSNRALNSTSLTDGKTYIHKFRKDPLIWGLPVNKPQAAGTLDIDGSGKIIVYEVSEDYQYVIVDENGKVVAVKPGNDSGSLTFPDLYPGMEYEVYEVGLGETVIPGMPIAAVGDKSDPNNILVPVLEDNYSITPDPAEDGKVILTINPADIDSKYGIIDENGNMVIVPDADGSGWVIPKGKNPSTVEFPGLDPNKEYTVVAVPKGTTGVNPIDRVDKGSTVITDPGVELEIPKYIVETIRGTVAEVDGQIIGFDRYDQIEKNQLVMVSADPTDSFGNSFEYWKVIIGSIPGVSGKITTLDLEFLMPETNVVVAAYYEQPSTSTPSNATVVDEVRGGNSKEMAVNPNEIGDLEETLTTDKDRELIDVNKAKITYKIIFDKNHAKGAEKDAIKADSLYDTGVDKEDAFTAPWAMDIRLERYVDGRRVDRATTSNASFDVIVQLENEHLDMLDYQLYQIVTDASGNITGLSLVPMVDLPEENGGVGGLFHFEGEIGGRYVLVYSKAYWVRFINSNYTQNDTYKYKVRKHYAINDSDYISDFNMIWDTPELEFDDNDGIHHTYIGWSTKKIPAAYKYYDPDKEVKKPVILYAYYENNMKEVQDAREKLDELLDKLLELADEHFVTKAEKNELIDSVKKAQDKLNQSNPKAKLEDLLTAIDKAFEVIDHYEPIIADRKQDYQDQHTSGNSSSGKGGSGGGGGSGSGTTKKPFVPDKINMYTVGVNGNWEHVPGTDKWAFVLNGGVHLSSMWAWLNYTDGDVHKTGWYHFDSFGIMNDGWFLDEAMNWYYCDTIHDGGFGKVKTGWHYDKDDKHWYYLSADTGTMLTGWREIDGIWYYFTAANHAETYEYDAVRERWAFKNVDYRPLGSMYTAEQTPDGYSVNANGSWIK